MLEKTKSDEERNVATLKLEARFTNMDVLQQKIDEFKIKLYELQLLLEEIEEFQIDVEVVQ